ncbi:Inner membrane protein ypdA [Raoultella terrigena]|uniref:histidine kinase n=2 Tax=Klebsiella/Raoultella group TaxID=2890311 RepID=A0A4U9CXN8_RAOTE|nr:Inner membrane protein ypdA [Raoultella terrigena]
MEGSLVNVRIIAVMSGGILFGPWVGAIVGVIAGVHRYLIDIDGVTAIPCFITSIIAGLLSGLIGRRVPKAQRWKAGILAGMLCETLTMILVVLWAPSFSLGFDIVSKIGIPMILGSVSIGFIVLLVQSVEGEKEASAARQAKLALDIANKTLPLFRHVNSESLRQVCDIIRRDINADAVAITTTDRVLAYVGFGEGNYHDRDNAISPTTRQAIESGKIIIKNNDEAYRTPEIHSMLVIPLREKGVVTGTLKIYYCHAHRITSSLQEMAIGLSQIISTQLEVSRAEQLREMANKAELRALQSKINPHFLFNALNAISSSIRMNPDTARQLIFNLSRYLRYNIELKDDEQIDIKRELYQIKDYIAIEQARFGDKLTVIYDIDDEVSCVIPSLLIQPLVENAIVHGIQPCKGKGVVTIGINECGNRVRISVRDTGNGIDPAVVARVEADEMPGNKIGLLNVHHRVQTAVRRGAAYPAHDPGYGDHLLRTQPQRPSVYAGVAAAMSGEKMKVIIVEDEFLAQQELTWLINTHSQMEIVGTFDDGLDVLKFLQHNRVDAIFLDINIPSLDGVLLAQNISQFAHKPFIVFITAWKEHAVEAFELEAFDYILKPYQESRIINMLQKLSSAWQQQQLPAASASAAPNPQREKRHHQSDQR